MTLNHMLSKACWFVDDAVDRFSGPVLMVGGGAGGAPFYQHALLGITLKPSEEHRTRKGLFIQDPP